WTVGYSPDLVVGVWTGNTNNAPMKNVSGSTGAGWIWRDVMLHTHEKLGIPPRPFEVPGEIEMRNVCGRMDLAVRGQEPKCWLGPQVAQPRPGAGPAPGRPGQPGQPGQPPTAQPGQPQAQPAGLPPGQQPAAAPPQPRRR
ncbi:MAG: hypothetical protein HY329_23475, partial [Chloroflexi bacterium]|nr:hypothetical protein [Chloroflexota bacterium]